jgi:hypothetical protein
VAQRIQAQPCRPQAERGASSRGPPRHKRGRWRVVSVAALRCRARAVRGSWCRTDSPWAERRGRRFAVAGKLRRLGGEQKRERLGGGDAFYLGGVFVSRRQDRRSPTAMRPREIAS